MLDKITYHRSAVEYNDALAEVAREKAESVEDPTVKKWCTSVMKQHEFHGDRHRSALEKLLSKQAEETPQHPIELESELTTQAAETAMGKHEQQEVPVETLSPEPEQIEVEADLSKENH